MPGIPGETHFDPSLHGRCEAEALIFSAGYPVSAGGKVPPVMKEDLVCALRFAEEDALSFPMRNGRQT